MKSFKKIKVKSKKKNLQAGRTGSSTHLALWVQTDTPAPSTPLPSLCFAVGQTVLSPPPIVTLLGQGDRVYSELKITGNPIFSELKPVKNLSVLILTQQLKGLD